MKNILLLVMLLVLSCKKERHENSEWLKATIAYTGDMNCGLPVLNFTEDSTKVRALTGQQFSLLFIVNGLPSNLNVQGQKLNVLVRTPKPEEAVVCRTIGPDYPGLKILNALPR
jgi:hypothetical protein